MTPVDELRASPSGNVPEEIAKTGAGKAENVNPSEKAALRSARGAMVLSTGVGAFHTTTVCEADALPTMFEATVLNVYEPGVVTVPDKTPVVALMVTPGGTLPESEYVALG